MINNIDKIGLGSVQFGIPYGISNKAGITTSAEVKKILNLAYKKGISIIDTARSYGRAEEIIGELNNKRFNIISKFMPSTDYEDIRFQCYESLKLLKVDVLYGYLAHRPGLLKDEDWEELQILKDENKVLKIGFSLNEPEEYNFLSQAGYYPDIIQVPFNYFDNRFRDLLIHLKSEGCEIHTRSTFLQGLFFMNPDHLDPYFNAFKSHINFLQESFGTDLQAALLNFSLQQDFIDTVIIGVENVGQLQKNLNNTLENHSLKEAPSFPPSILMPVNWPKN